MIELLDMFVRGISFVAMVGSVGGAVFYLAVLRPALICAGGETAQSAAKMTARVARASSLLLGAATIAATFLFTASVSDSATRLESPVLFDVLFLSSYGRALLARAGLALGMGFLYGLIAKAPGRILLWRSALIGGVLVVASVSASGHAAAVADQVFRTVFIDSLHLIAVAAWIGGLFYLRLVVNSRETSPVAIGNAVSCFSPLALTCAAIMVATGFLNALRYVGSIEALFATSYGLTLVAKVFLVIPLVVFGATNFLVLRPALGAAPIPSPPLLRRFASITEGEIVIGLAILLLAGALTALPYAGGAPVATDSLKSLLEPRWPHLSTPTPRDVWEKEFPQGVSSPVQVPEAVAYSEFNHQWAGAFVVAAGILSFFHAFRKRWLWWAGIWPLSFVGLAIFLLFRNDPGVWPVGPIGFWESVGRRSDVLQHRLYVFMVGGLGVIEWMGRAGKIHRSWWTFLFPGLCLVGSLMLFLHFHDGGLQQADSLTHIQHTVIGILALLAAISRWLELRLAEEGRFYGKLWGLCVTLLGMILVFFYREV
jgi:copper resistance protein D